MDKNLQKNLPKSTTMHQFSQQEKQQNLLKDRKMQMHAKMDWCCVSKKLIRALLILEEIGVFLQ
jgi:hypothetical protein